MGHGAALSDQRRILRRCTGACATMVLPCRAVRCELPVVTHGAGHSFAAARSYRDMLKDLDTVVEVASDTSTPVPMSALAAQLFRLGKTARGRRVDALEIYKLSALQAAK